VNGVASADTLVEKILLAHCDADVIRPGDVRVRCDCCRGELGDAGGLVRWTASRIAG
jgi:hypothetical protein